MAIADITKPMALDETLQGTNTALGNLNTTNGSLAKDASLNTTETTPRNIADVLADELGRIANLLKPDADDIDYDNTSSGLSATNVQDAIDEIQEGITETGATKTESSTTNGNIKINNVETPVYRNYANNTVLSTDKSPYLNRPCLTPTGFSSYVREKLIGCSVAWNNLCNGSSVTVPSGHKYLLKKSGVLSLGESTGSAITGLTSGTDVVTDLTLAFGSTIADYLYGLSDNGGITKLRDMGCPIDSYTSYGYGLYSAKPTAKKIYDSNNNLLATYDLGSTELRGHLIVQNGEIVAEGDVRESNGNVNRTWKNPINLGDLTWTYVSSVPIFYADLPSDAPTPIMGGYSAVCAKYACHVGEYDTQADKSFTICNLSWTNAKRIFIKDSAYTDVTTFKNSLSGIELTYPLATPTTETSSPFADPMSLNGCTTEEYVDDRTIPVPVGHETQYMGQSEDVVEIPSTPQSDGVWVQKCYVSGGKAQYVWELET